MVEENTLAKNISSAGDKAAYDAACKKLLAHKSILAWILKSCVEEYRDCDLQDIANKYIEGEPQIAQVAVNPDEIPDGEQIKGASTEDSTMHEGTITYDIRFYAVAPVSGETISLIINVEAQNDFYPGYPIVKRGVYYCSRMISSQFGREFTGAHYDKIKKVYSIWICMNPPGFRKNTINRYSIKEEHLAGAVSENIQNYDLMSAVMICLGDPDDESTGILKLLEVLLSSEREADEKKRILQEDFSIEMTKTLESEVSHMCNLSKGVEEKGIAIGEERGIAIGEERGIAIGEERGMEKGMEKGILLSLKNLMKSSSFTVEKALDALMVPEADRMKYRKELNK